MKHMPKRFVKTALLAGAILLQAFAARADIGSLVSSSTQSATLFSVAAPDDGSGSYYVAGYGSGIYHVGDVEVNTAGTIQVFVAKIDYQGNVVWLNIVPSTQTTNLQYPYIAADNSGNVYMAVEYGGTLNFPSATLSSAGFLQAGLCVAKLGPDGHWIWARNAGSPTGYGTPNGISVRDDSNGPTGKVHVAVSGAFRGTLVLGPQTLTTTTASPFNFEGFFGAINADTGQWVWADRPYPANTLDPNDNGASQCFGVTHDTNGDVFGMFLRGKFNATVPANRSAVFFVRKAASVDGHRLDDLSIIGTIPSNPNDPNTPYPLLSGTSITTDTSGNAYIGVIYRGQFSFSGGVTTPPSLGNPGTNKIFLAKLDVSPTPPSTGFKWEWANKIETTGDVGSAYLTNDAEGALYAAVTVSGTSTWGSTNLGGSTLGYGVFAKANPAGTWQWAKAGIPINTPFQASTSAGRIVLDGFGFVTVVTGFNGTQGAVYGPRTLTAPNGQASAVVKLDDKGNWLQGNVYIGQPIYPPPGAAKVTPSFQLLAAPSGVDGPTSNLWCASCPDPNNPSSPGAHFLTAPVSGILRWKTSTVPTDPNTIDQLVVAQFPPNPQIHIANVPVDLELGQTDYTYASMRYTTSPGASDLNKIFKATSDGYSVLMYAKGSVFNTNVNPVAFTVARTVFWDSTDCTANPSCLTETTWPIGQKITNASHSDPSGKNGYVFNENSHYDGVGPEAAYDRPARTGTILPVNEDTEDPDDDLVVVWYKPNSTTGVPWPVKPVRYEAVWPPASSLYRATATGTPSSVLSFDDDQVVGLTAYNGKVYWTDQLHGRVRRSNQDGTSVETLATGVNRPGEITASSGKLYWAETGSGKIRSMDPNSPSVITDLATGLAAPFGVEVIPGGTHGGVYYTDVQTHKVMKVPLAGGAATTVFSGPGQPYGLGGVGGGTVNILVWSDQTSGKIRLLDANNPNDPNGPEDLTTSTMPGVMESEQIVGTTFVLWGDGIGNVHAFDLAARTDSIRANVPGASSLAVDRMIVPTDAHGDFSWATTDSKLVIANQIGSDASGPPMDPAVFPSKMIYNQADPSLPGYNPNDEQALFEPSNTGQPFDALFALRSDLTAGSEPNVLLKYRNTKGTVATSDDEWAMKVYSVSPGTFVYTGTAGQVVQPPYPLGLLGACTQAPKASYSVGTPAFKDYKGTLWARSDGSLDVYYYYPLQSSFTHDINADGVPDAASGECVPWLDRLGTIGTPIKSAYTIVWPSNPPALQIGETLLNEKNGLPNIVDRSAAKVIFDESDPDELDPNAALAQLIDPLSERSVSYNVTSLPTDLGVELDGARRVIVSGQNGVVKVPFHLRTRLRFDPVLKKLVFRGHFDQTGDFLIGAPLLLPNVMTASEKTFLQSLSTNAGWDDAVRFLYEKTRNPQGLDLTAPSGPDTDFLIGLQPKNGDPTKAQPLALRGVRGALTAGLKQKTGALTTGFVTLAFDDDPTLNPSPVSLSVIKVVCGPYQGQVHVIKPDNVFDEQLTLRHSGDFGGAPDLMDFQWSYKPANGPDPPTVFPDPDNNQLNGWTSAGSGTGVNSVVIGGPSVLTISDNWFISRYKGYPACGNATAYSAWAGSAFGDPNDPEPQLAEGWIKRVTKGLNPFDQALSDFHNPLSPAPNTFASMLQQLGSRYEGDISMSPNPASLQGLRLIPAYETALRRALGLSVDAGLNYAPANDALLNISGRLADFYMLLGNEAYADATDPTIGYSTTSGALGSLAPAVFAFENQLDSLLEEELGLLRGRDQKGASPVYNRLLWNFTNGDGQVAYVQSYNISDQNNDGKLDVTDASILFPQAHGDAWGHYLSAMHYYYQLLRHPNYTWIPRAELITVGGPAIPVDYQDERKFARAAAAKAKAGTEIMDLTYRLNYVEDPSGQWQGYKDTDPARAWGVTEWATRAGQGAYIDWAVANAILPAVDPVATHTGIQKVDRTTVLDIAEIATNMHELQRKMDKADQGLNPIGIAKGSIPFDIDPSLLSGAGGIAGKSHFEQIYERAQTALRSAVKVFDNANQLSQMLRRNQDSVEQFQNNVEDQERDLRNRLIELYGTPYAEDFQPAGTYPIGYDGADFYHFQYVDPTELTGTAAPQLTIEAQFAPINDVVSSIKTFFPGFDKVTLADPILTVPYTLSSDGAGIVKPAGWTLRRSPGELQKRLSDFYLARADFQRSVKEYDNLLAQIAAETDLLELRYGINKSQIEILQENINYTVQLNSAIAASNSAAGIMHGLAQITLGVSDAAVEAFPRVVGVAYDATSWQRSLLKGAMIAATIGLEIGAGVESGKAAGNEQSKEISQLNTALRLRTRENEFQNAQFLAQLQELIRQEPVRRLQVFTQKEIVRQSLADFAAKVAEGERLIQEVVILRQRTAAQVSDYRYQDMAFRIFRNDALQKYRAAFDLAARYAYLAATAYDYETNLLGTSSQAGRRFLTDIVRFRSLGQLVDGEPVAGSRGLADPLARLKANFDVLKGQLGFNNPQVENNGFSLREELLRLQPRAPANGGPVVDTAWQARLQSFRVSNLNSVPAFKKYCRPFAPPSAGALPGLVIPFSTTVTYGKNFFDWPLGGGDSAFDATHFATKVRSAGLALIGYNDDALSATPRVYLVPAGMDVMRSPSGDTLATREFKVLDQAVPPPFPVGDTDLADPSWIPLNDSLPETLGAVRRYSTFKAFPEDDLDFDPLDITTESRLVGRSVWNTRWLLIVPGSTLLADPLDGLDTFILGPRIPGGGGERDGNGIKDIRLFFTTYAYSGQ